MKKIFLTKVVLVLMFSISLFGQNRVAVIPFTGGDADDGATIANLFEAELKDKNTYFEVIPRTQTMREFARESKYRKTGITDADAICRVGRLVQADYVVTGHIHKLGIDNILILNITEVATYRKAAGAYHSYSLLNEIKSYLPTMVNNMVYYTLTYRSNNAPKLAAAPFDLILKSGTKEIEAELLVDMLTGDIANTGKYTVIQRTTTIEMIMSEEDIRRSKLTSKYIMSKIGQAVDAEYVLSGTIPKHGRDTLIDAQILNIDTANQKSSGRVEYRNLVDGPSVMDDLSYQLVGVSPAIEVTHVTHINENNNSRSSSNTSSTSRSSSLETTKLLSEERNGMREIKTLISNGNVNTKNERGWTALMYASYYGHTDIVSSLISDGADVNAKNNDGVTALMWASAEGNRDVAKILIDAKADVNAKNNKGATALSWTTTYGHTEIVRLLKNSGAR